MDWLFASFDHHKFKSSLGMAVHRIALVCGAQHGVGGARQLRDCARIACACARAVQEEDVGGNPA
jgi:hypothetical protein